MAIIFWNESLKDKCHPNWHLETRVGYQMSKLIWIVENFIQYVWEWPLHVGVKFILDLEKFLVRYGCSKLPSSLGSWIAIIWRVKAACGWADRGSHDGEVQCMGCMENAGPRLGRHRTRGGGGSSGRSRARGSPTRGRARRLGVQAGSIGAAYLGPGPYTGAVACPYMGLSEQ
jgi:hypothetical protein